MAQIVRYREGGVTVTVDEGIARWVETVLRSAGDSTYERIEAGIGDVYRAAITRWPVRTGRSRDGLRSAVTLDRTAGRVEGSILALVPYSVYVKSAKNGLKGKNAWQELARRPVGELKKRLLAELGDVIVAGGRRRAR